MDRIRILFITAILAFTTCLGCTHEIRRIKIERTPPTEVSRAYRGSVHLFPITGENSKFLGRVYIDQGPFVDEPPDETLTVFVAEVLREAGYTVTVGPLKPPDAQLEVSGELVLFNIYNLLSTFTFRDRDERVLWTKHYNSEQHNCKSYSNCVTLCIDELLQKVAKDVTERFGSRE